jgi:ABC-type antimicrobial peptide transport system permease subunit
LNVVSFSFNTQKGVSIKIKRMLGLFGIVLGVLLIWFSVHAKGKKLSRYEMMIRWSMIGGVVLIAAGAFVAIRARKR